MGSFRFHAVALAVLLASFPAHVHAQPDSVRVGGLAIPGDQADGFVGFPEGDVFRTLLADPKAVKTFGSYVRGTSESALGTDLASVGVGDRLALMRWGGPRPGEGVQIGLEAGVFAQFDLNQPSLDLVNADYVVGLPLTFRRGPFSNRLRLYHQSSHLGDEFLLRARIQRENFAYEAIEEILSWDFAFVRAYGGGEFVFNEEPEGVATSLAHAGIELRPLAPLLRLGRNADLDLVAAADAKATSALDWRPGLSVRAGFEIANSPEFGHVTRRWALLGEYYDGPSPYGQFFRSDVTYYGVGLHFSP